MRIWKETSLNSFPFSIIAVTTCVAVSPEYVESCKTLWCHQSLFGWDSKGKTRPPGKQSRMGGGKKGVFEAWVNEVLSPIWGEEERMSERLPVRQTVIPADGSFDSKDKCLTTAGSTCSTHTHRGADLWIQSTHTRNVTLRIKWESCNSNVVLFWDIWADKPPWGSDTPDNISLRGCVQIGPLNTGVHLTRRQNDPVHLSDALLRMKPVAVRAFIIGETAQITEPGKV